MNYLMLEFDSFEEERYGLLYCDSLNGLKKYILTFPTKTELLYLEVWSDKPSVKFNPITIPYMSTSSYRHGTTFMNPTNLKIKQCEINQPFFDWLLTSVEPNINIKKKI